MSKTQHTLLIVDDCPEDREVYRDFLQDDPHTSYQILEAPLAEVGLDLFQQQSFDAILLDFHMPDMTGLEFLCELKANSLSSCPPIIMLTGEGNESVAVTAIKQGIQDYLVKQHLQPEILQMAVRSVIQQSQLQSQLSKKREQQRLIATTALRIRQSLDLNQILSTAIAEVQQLLECDHVGVYQCLEDSVGGQGATAIAEIGQRTTLPACCNDASAMAGSYTSAKLHHSAGIRSLNEDLVVPISIFPRQHSSGEKLSSAKDEVWGYLVAYQKDKQVSWQSDEQTIVSELSVQLAIAIRQSELLSDAQAALKESQQLIQFKSQIISTISHEYRTPLSAILGAASTIERHQDVLSPDKQAHFLEMIQEKARHMTVLVDDMLLMHQCDLKQAKFEPSPLNLLEFVADLVEEQRDLLSDSHEIVFQVLGRVSGFWGDRGLLRFAISNLLSNAVKYSPNGGTVEVLIAGKEKMVELSVKDQGIGIPLVDQPNLFQSFSRASNVGTIPGTGLGLSISKSCIKLHNGEITLESQENQGTKVMVTLPKEPDTLKQWS